MKALDSSVRPGGWRRLRKQKSGGQAQGDRIFLAYAKPSLRGHLLMKSLKVYSNPILENQHSAVVVTLLIAFYNDLRMLEFQLQNLLLQTMGVSADTKGLQFEVIICDDGSKPEVVARVRELMDASSIPIKHLWHEDLGFRKNRMLNWGLFHSDSSYIIFIDQDCLPHSEFVREHYLARQRGAVLCGRRMELTPWVSSLLSLKSISQKFIEKNLWWIILFGLPVKDTNGIKGVYFRSEFLRRLSNRTPRAIVGCNFSIHREDMLKINGFDWRYEAPGTGEDSDIDFRLSLNKVIKIPMIGKAVQYHIYHKHSSRSSKNAEIFADVVKANNAVTEFGLSQQLKISAVSMTEMRGPQEDVKLR